MTKSFRGRLTPEQLAEGINACRRNACRLAEDARTLMDSGSHATAASLAALSFEEFGKMAILNRLALARDDEEAAVAWREFRDHKRKNTTWILPLLVARGARSLDDMRPIVDSKSKHPAVLNQLKQDGFYTNFAEDTGWSEPAEAVDKALAEFVVRGAEVMAPSSPEATTEGIELWIKHLGPVWGTNMDWMKQALVLLDAEMKKRGLSTGSQSSMEEFVRGTGQYASDSTAMHNDN